MYENPPVTISKNAQSLFSDYTSEQNIDGATLEKRPSSRGPNEDLLSNSGTSTSVPRSIEINLARDRIGSLARNGGTSGGGAQYTAGNVIQGFDIPYRLH